MVKEFLSNIEKQSLFKKKDKLLVAVSGGVDSMVLCHLLKTAGFNIHAAHCNFQLRGVEADEDEQSVKSFCEKNKIPFLSKRFETKNTAKKKKISIQMAARELRYEWFNELIKSKGFKFLLTAHHLNDNIETFFINLCRGTGLKGLKGIEEKHNNIIRPLLNFKRKEIENYAKENKIPFRTDSSNNDDKYLRNYLRLKVIPMFKELNPSFDNTLNSEINLINKYYRFLQKHISVEKSNVVESNNNTVKINIKELLNTTEPQLILFEILNEFNFNPSTVNDVFQSINGIPGKRFNSETHTLIKDRAYLIIEQNQENTIEDTFIKKGQSHIKKPVNLKLKQVPFFELTRDTHVIHIDADKLVYPLKLRHWIQGDKFKPFGMKGFKKLSDYFKDLKLNHFDKKNILILENGNKEIIWILNHRMDDRYKIGEKTKHILKLEIVDKF